MTNQQRRQLEELARILELQQQQLQQQLQQQQDSKKLSSKVKSVIREADQVLGETIDFFNPFKW